MNPLQALRISRHLSVAELAQRLGLGRAQLVDIEAGKRLLSSQEKADFADRLDIPPQTLDSITRGNAINK